MLEIAKKIGVTVRKEKGRFSGGNCVINDKKMIVINNSVPMEMKTSMLAKCLLQFEINNVFIKPAVRDYIEKEQRLDFKEDNSPQFVINFEQNQN